MKRTIKTKIHTYRFDTDTPQGRTAYEAFCAARKKEGSPKIFASISAGEKNHHDFVKPIDGQEVELELAHIFDNQWNTAPIVPEFPKGARVFDWAEDVFPIYQRDHIKQGHWLEQTSEMKEAREQFVKCGYCGHQEQASDRKFCDRCLGSEYLKSSDLPLLRLVPAGHSFAKKREPLTESEVAFLLPRYQEAQLKGAEHRREKALEDARKKVQADYEEDLKKAEERKQDAEDKRAAMTWLLDRGLSINNVIYYSHTKRFSFGWRGAGVDTQVEKMLLDHMSEFPFAYEIKCADGRLLQNEH